MIRSWLQEATEADREALVQFFRFDQALGESLAASMKDYTRRLERMRHLALGALGQDLRTLKPVVIDELRAYHPGRELSSRASGDLGGTWDRARIEQMASNLISNALKCSRPGE